ncbi:MAG: hypothetical protein ACREBC_18700, partial [Pyrinomonadaceae bacterium]
YNLPVFPGALGHYPQSQPCLITDKYKRPTKVNEAARNFLFSFNVTAQDGNTRKIIMSRENISAGTGRAALALVLPVSGKSVAKRGLTRPVKVPTLSSVSVWVSVCFLCALRCPLW